MILTKDNVINILQIIIQNEKIYLFKLAAYIFIITTIWIEDTTTIESSIFIGIITLILTTAIDLIILSNTAKARGIIIFFHLIYLLLVIFAGVLPSLLLLAGKITLTSATVNYFNATCIFCCFNPLFEMTYSTISHLQIERKSAY